jgi:hypothetical protein
MTITQWDSTQAFIRAKMDTYQRSRVDKLTKLKPQDVLARKNPYIFLSKNLGTADELAELILQAHTSSSEETQFGQLLEDVAIYVSELVYGGQKSSTTGIDLDVRKDGIRYLIAIKSGKNWGNADQIAKLKTNFAKAKQVLAQNSQSGHVEAMLGVCYGITKDGNNGIYLFKGGQSFWYFISGESSFYTDVIEPIGHEAEVHSETFKTERDKAKNRFVKFILDNFCDNDGLIDWKKFVKFNSGNLD